MMLVTHDNNLLFTVTLHLFQRKENAFKEPESSIQSNKSDILLNMPCCQGLSHTLPHFILITLKKFPCFIFKNQIKLCGSDGKIFTVLFLFNSILIFL